MEERPSAFIDGAGVKQIPIKEVTRRVDIGHTTLLRWAAQGVMPNGQPIKLFRNPKGWLFLDETTVGRLEDRFETLPDRKPAGKITLGLSPDQSGFIPPYHAWMFIEELNEWRCADRLQTLIKDASQGTELPDLHLELIVDPFHGDKRYVREKSIRVLLSPEARATIWPKVKTRSNTLGPQK